MRRIIVLVLALTFALQSASTLAFAAAAQGTATLAGTARSSSGQLIENCTVQLRDVLTGQLVGTTKCDRAGAFVFTNLNPGNYVVEVVNAEGVVIGTSAVSTVAAGATVAVSVTAATAAGATTGGISTALIVTTLAAAAGVAAVVVVANRGQASSSQ
jgi:carboxypeptidase family protein